MRERLLAERLLAYREDLAEWFADLFRQNVSESSFIRELASGVRLCQLAKLIQDAEQRKGIVRHDNAAAHEAYDSRAQEGTFHARDNIAQYLRWAKHLGVKVLFEADDLVQRRNEKTVLYCLMEVARVQQGVDPPRLVAIERALDKGVFEIKDAQDEFGLLHDIQKMLEHLRIDKPVEMISASDFRIGDSVPLKIVDLRGHIMVRLKNSWDTLENYLATSHATEARPASGRKFLERTAVQQDVHERERKQSVADMAARWRRKSASNSSASGGGRGSAGTLAVQAAARSAAAVEEMEAELIRLRETNRRLQEDHDHTRIHVSDIEGKYEETLQSLELLRNQQAQMKDGRHEDVETISELRRQLTSSAQALSKSEAKGELVMLKDRVATLERELEHGAVVHAEDVARVGVLRKEIDGLLADKVEKDDLRAQMDVAEAAHAEVQANLREALSSAAMREEELEKTAAAREEELEKAAAARENAFRGERELLEQQLKQQQAQIDDHMIIAEKAVRTIEMHQKTIDQSRRDAKKEAARLRDEADAHRTTADEHAKRADEHAARADEHEANHARERDAHASSRTAHATELEALRASLTAELEAAKHQHAAELRSQADKAAEREAQAARVAAEQLAAAQTALHDELEAHAAENKAQAAKLAALHDELAAHAAEAQAQAEAIAARDALIAEREATLSNRDRALAERDAAQARLQAELDAALAQIDALRAEIAQLKDQLATALQERDQARAALATTKADLGVVRADLAREQAEVARLRSSLAEAERTVIATEEAAASSRASAEKAIATLEESLSALQADKAAFEAHTREEAEATAKASAAELERLKASSAEALASLEAAHAAAVDEFTRKQEATQAELALQQQEALTQRKAREGNQKELAELRLQSRHDELERLTQEGIIKAHIEQYHNPGEIKANDHYFSAIDPMKMDEEALSRICTHDEPSADANIARMEQRMALADAERGLRIAQRMHREAPSEQTRDALTDYTRRRDELSGTLAEAEAHFRRVALHALERLRREEVERNRQKSESNKMLDEPKTRADLLRAHKVAELRVAELERLHDEEGQAVEELVEARATLADLKRMLADAEDQHDQDQKLIDTLMERIAALESGLDTPNNRLARLRAEVSTWIAALTGHELHADARLLRQLQDGIALCELANAIDGAEEETRARENPDEELVTSHNPENKDMEDISALIRRRPLCEIEFFTEAAPGTPEARSNIQAFLRWCKTIGIDNPPAFKVEDLERARDELEVLCGLLDVARHTRGIQLPLTVEEERMKWMAATTSYSPVKNDTVDAAVGDMLNKLPEFRAKLKRVGAGRYQLADDRKVLLMRVLKDNVMVRVGGGWQDLEEYLVMWAKRGKKGHGMVRTSGGSGGTKTAAGKGKGGKGKGGKAKRGSRPAVGDGKWQTPEEAATTAHQMVEEVRRSAAGHLGLHSTRALLPTSGSPRVSRKGSPRGSPASSRRGSPAKKQQPPSPLIESVSPYTPQ